MFMFQKDNGVSYYYISHMWSGTKIHSCIHIFLPLSQHHRCVFIAGGKGRRKHDYYLLYDGLRAFIAAPRGALSIPMLFCETSAGTLAFVLLTGAGTTHTNFLHNVWLLECTRGGLTSSQRLLYDSLLCKPWMDMLKKKDKDICTSKHLMSCWI